MSNVLLDSRTERAYEIARNEREDGNSKQVNLGDDLQFLYQALVFMQWPRLEQRRPRSGFPSSLPIQRLP